VLVPRTLILQVIGTKLEGEEVVAARLVCRTWAQNISEGVDSARAFIHADPLACTMAVTTIRRLMPRASTLEVFMSTRLQQARMAGWVV
jgi:hypothetical protein